jgi:hypothetical protein
VNQRLGFFAADDFRIVDGRCSDCPTPRQALWYFEADHVAVPRPGVPVADFTPARSREAEVAEWSKGYADGAPLPRPSLVWIGSPELVERLIVGGPVGLFGGQWWIRCRVRRARGDRRLWTEQSR